MAIPFLLCNLSYHFLKETDPLIIDLNLCTTRFFLSVNRYLYIASVLEDRHGHAVGDQIWNDPALYHADLSAQYYQIDFLDAMRIMKDGYFTVQLGWSDPEIQNRLNNLKECFSSVSSSFEIFKTPSELFRAIEQNPNYYLIKHKPTLIAYDNLTFKR